MEHLKTVAIVDDDPAIIKLLKEACTPLYKIVGTAANGIEAITLVKATQPDVLLMDVHMPEMDGLLALKQIASFKTTAVVMLTANQDPATARQAMDFGACSYMTKPFDVSQIPAVIESAWHHLQTIRVLEEQTRALTENLEVRKLLEKAKGILMEQQGHTEQEAHQTIQKMSQNQGISVKELCRSLIQVQLVLGGKAKAKKIA